MLCYAAVARCALCRGDRLGRIVAAGLWTNSGPQDTVVWYEYGMSMVKVTFTLDDQTVATLRQAGARLGKPNSQIVRDAIRDYAERIGRLSEPERLRMLSAVDALLKRKPTRTTAEVERELRDIRSARRAGGRRRHV